MSRKLRILLKKNRLIEEKLFYRTKEGDWRKDLINHKDLLGALTCIATKIIENPSAELSVLTMLDDLDIIRTRPLDHFDKNALQVVEILFNYLRLNTEFDPKFYHILNSLQLAFTRLALDDLSFLDNEKHPAITFLEKIIDIGYHFDESAGRTTRFFVRAIELLVDRLASRDIVTTKLFTQAHRRLDEYQASLDKRVAIEKNAIIKKVEHETRQIQADFYTSHLIKSKTDGDEIAIFLLDFFENQLSQVLHKVILEHGVQSKQCQQLLTDMDSLSWSVSSAFGDPDFKIRFDADVQPAMNRLYSIFEQDSLANEYVKAFYLEIERIHVAKLEGKRVQIDTMISASIFDDDTFGDEDIESWSESNDEKYDISHLTEGSWYYLNIDGKNVRSNLLMINDHTEKLYFINLSGELLQAVDFDAHQFLYSNLSNFVLNEQIHYRHAIKALERELNSKLEVLEVEYETFKQQAVIDEKQREQLEERAKQAILDRLAVEKKLADQKRQELQLKKQKQLAKAIEIERIEAEKRFKAKGVIRNLGPGSMVAVLTKDQKWVEGSLMIFSRTTKRYIFADSSGNKIIEPTKNELIDLIDSNMIRIIKASASIADPLQSLVANRRAKLSERL